MKCNRKYDQISSYPLLRIENIKPDLAGSVPSESYAVHDNGFTAYRIQVEWLH